MLKQLPLVRFTQPLAPCRRTRCLAQHVGIHAYILVHARKDSEQLHQGPELFFFFFFPFSLQVAHPKASGIQAWPRHKVAFSSRGAPPHLSRSCYACMKNKRLLPLYLSRKKKKKILSLLAFFFVCSTIIAHETLLDFLSLRFLPLSAIPGDGRVEEPEQGDGSYGVTRVRGALVRTLHLRRRY